MMTQEQQAIILEEHYQQCFAFWRRAKHTDVSASAMALIDILRTKRNPFVPNGESIEAEVRRVIVNTHLNEFGELIKAELETSIKDNKNE